MTSGKPPLDEQGFTAFMADRFRQAVPDYAVTIEGPLTIKIDSPGDPLTCDLSRAHEYCRSQPGDMTEWLESYVEKARAYLEGMNAPIDRTMLRIAVRTNEYVERMQRDLAEKGLALTTEFLTDDLTAVCYIDLPTVLRTALPKDFEALGLTADDAMEVAKDNLAAGQDEFLASLNHHDGIAILTGDVYQSSWFALPEFFEDLADLYDGGLLVAVPAADSLLYARETDELIIAMHEAAEDVADRNERPISKSVYRWTPEGWTTVPGPISIGGKNVYLRMKPR